MDSISIYERLKQYSASGYYGFHMPGHKRNVDLMEGTSPYQVDITEIDGFDDLHHADGILKEAQERAACVYHAQETHFLINGSTVGILSAILGITKRGDRILVARNCHKSVYHAIYMNELRPVYLYPEFDEKHQINGEISALAVEKALEEEPSIRAVVIVSPTYDGVVSDVGAIAGAVHRKGIPLIVDEAHGAHFGFHPYFPENSNQKGADVVIHSLHKTLPSLTQTALLHMNGEFVNRVQIRKYLHMLQSSSPSYVLMAGIDSCIRLLAEGASGLFEPYVSALERTRLELGKLAHLRLESTKNYDFSKILISTGDTGITGKELYETLLKEYHLQMEMKAGGYVLAMTSPGDTEEDLERLVHALFQIDERLQKTQDRAVFISTGLPVLSQYCTSAEAENLGEGIRDVPGHIIPGKRAVIPWEKSSGFISLEYAYLYPPGIPLVVPGEELTKEAVLLLEWYREAGYEIEGLKRQGQIEVWIDG